MPDAPIMQVNVNFSKILEHYSCDTYLTQYSCIFCFVTCYFCLAGFNANVDTKISRLIMLSDALLAANNPISITTPKAIHYLHFVCDLKTNCSFVRNLCILEMKDCFDHISDQWMTDTLVYVT